MSQMLFSVEQVAERLGLHVRTVRNYVRDGRLKAVRIGKQYRIASEDIEALTGRPPTERESRQRHAEISSVVEIDAIDPDTANRLTTMLMASANGRRVDAAPLRVQTIHDPERARLKIVLIGSLDDHAAMVKLIDVLLQP